MTLAEQIAMLEQRLTWANGEYAEVLEQDIENLKRLNGLGALTGTGTLLDRKQGA